MARETREVFLMKSIATEKRGLYITAILLVAVCLVAFFAGRYLWLNDQKIPVKVLILPKFEVGELTGDFPGEAQLFYEEYVCRW